MKNDLWKALWFLNILFLGSILVGIAIADNTQSDQIYGSYPGELITVPTPASTAIPSSGQPRIVGPYSSGPAIVPITPDTCSCTKSDTAMITAICYPHSPPVAEQNAVHAYNVGITPPTRVFYAGAYVPWVSFYRPDDYPLMWVSTSCGWSWYATCPLGGWAKEIMYVPTTESMKLYELYPDGTAKYQDFGFTPPGYKYVWFHADMPGRYRIMITASDIPSNYITIDVV